jgi:cobyrinic acid a,c-diamide synthase
VVNATRTTRSLAALVSGFQNFETDTPIRGVVLNNVAGAKPGGRHEQRARRAIEQHCDVPVVGALPRLEGLHIPDRHLGLVPMGERDAAGEVLEACRLATERYLDLDAIMEIASDAPQLKIEDGSPATSEYFDHEPVRIGVLRDRAFSFYYPENLSALERSGAKLVFIDALHEAELPPVSGLYIGGGFPEIFAGELQANRSLREDIRKAIESDLPVYAECGGLMYLCRSLTWRGISYEMVGALPYRVEMTERPQGHGYVSATVTRENPFYPVGLQLRGHEFHNSRLKIDSNGTPGALSMQRGTGMGAGIDGLTYRQVFAAYTHLHSDGAPGWADALVRLARAYTGDKLPERDNG